MIVVTRSESIELDRNFLARLENIDWFSKCGTPEVAGKAYSIMGVESQEIGHIYVPNWEQAIASARNEEWESVTMWFTNELSAFLFYECHKDFNARWNRVGRTANEWFAVSVAPKVREKLSSLCESDITIVLNDIQRTIRGAIQEHEFSSCGNHVMFYRSLLNVLENGHYPCGWQLPWPDGKIIVF